MRFKWAALLAAGVMLGALVSLGIAVGQKSVLGVAAAGVAALVGIGVAILSLHDR